MQSKLTRNYSINLLLAIMAIVCGGTGVLLYFKPQSIMSYLSKIPIMPLHIWTGFVMIGAVLLHLILHTKWIKAVTKQMVSNKKGALAVVGTVCVSMGIFFAIAATNPAQTSTHGPAGEGYQTERSFRHGHDDFSNDRNYVDDNQETQEGSDV